MSKTYCLLVLFGLICAANSLRKRIYGGYNITIEDAPYQVSIQRVGKGHICGGSIISENYVLTAGHCADDDRSYYNIRVGSSLSRKGGNFHFVLNVTRHEGYAEDKWARPDHDVALMKVIPPFRLDNVTKKAIRLNERVINTGDVGFLTGWGSTENKKGPSDQLQGLSVKVIGNDECAHDYEDKNGLKKYNFCAEHPSRNKDLCNGDSGGPLVINGTLAGIVSWSGPGCAIPGRPGAYVDIVKYLDWIHKHML